MADPVGAAEGAGDPPPQAVTAKVSVASAAVPRVRLRMRPPEVGRSDDTSYAAAGKVVICRFRGSHFRDVTGTLQKLEELAIERYRINISRASRLLRAGV
ncbi:hypothetical protein GCM10012289_37550 [Nonomuraea cavernae]|uniref:Uncharacterized protein n=1 Tax=Nonomuraea cavernae TaxID=2045107 RepID=A0A918DLH0_9ACTN|nr:hypothetical protein GCM10012289_37550 [Nonomuraea cavernae]